MAIIDFDFGTWQEGQDWGADIEPQDLGVRNGSGGAWTESVAPDLDGLGNPIIKQCWLSTGGLTVSLTGIGPDGADGSGFPKFWGKWEVSVSATVSDPNLSGSSSGSVTETVSRYQQATNTTSVGTLSTLSVSGGAGSYQVPFDPSVLAYGYQVSSDSSVVTQNNSGGYSTTESVALFAPGSSPLATISLTIVSAYSVNQWVSGYITECASLYSSQAALSGLSTAAFWTKQDGGTVISTYGIPSVDLVLPPGGAATNTGWFQSGLTGYVIFQGQKYLVQAQNWKIGKYAITPSTEAYTGPTYATQSAAPPPGQVLSLDPDFAFDQQWPRLTNP